MRVSLGSAAACVVCFALSIFTTSASAHHSHGQYEEAFSDIQGVVKEMHLLTPHSWVYIEVADPSGMPQLWAHGRFGPDCQRGQHGAPGVVFMRRGETEVDQEAIAEHLRRVAVEPVDDHAAGAVVLAKDVAPVLRVKPFVQRRGVDDVAEQYGELSALSGRWYGRW